MANAVSSPNALRNIERPTRRSPWSYNARSPASKNRAAIGDDVVTASRGARARGEDHGAGDHEHGGGDEPRPPGPRRHGGRRAVLDRRLLQRSAPRLGS